MNEDAYNRFVYELERPRAKLAQERKAERLAEETRAAREQVILDTLPQVRSFNEETSAHDALDAIRRAVASHGRVHVITLCQMIAERTLFRIETLCRAAHAFDYDSFAGHPGAPPGFERFPD